MSSSVSIKKELCIYCRNVITFLESDVKVYCPACGQSFAATLFGTALRDQKALEDEVNEKQASIDDLNEQKCALENEKRETEQKLIDTLSALDDIHADLADKARDDAARSKALSELTAFAGDFRDETRTGLCAVASLVTNLAETEKADSRHLSNILMALMQSQDGLDGKLDVLRNFAEKLSSAQNDLAKRNDILQEYMPVILTVAKGNETLMHDLIGVTHQYNRDEMTLLGSIVSCVDTIRLAQQQNTEKLQGVDEQISSLQSAVEKGNAALASFHREYTEDKKKKLENLYTQANHRYADREFEKAEELYGQTIIDGTGDIAEVYWRKLMAHYGVEYVYSEHMKEYVPTLFNLEETLPGELSDAKELLRISAGTDEENDYREKLETLSRIVDRYLQVKLENEFDVFISVKQQDGGAYTDDGNRASDLYVQLQKRGFKVFNSRCSYIPAGDEYEPYILAALRSARMLIVVGSKAEYINAPWVQNEWKRYSWLMRNDEKNHGSTKRHLIPYLFGDMKPEMLPPELRGLQAIVEGTSTETKLNKAIDEAFPREKPIAVGYVSAPAPTHASADARIEHAFAQLRQGEFKNAKKNLIEIQKDSATDARVYLGLLMAELKLKTPDELANHNTPLEKYHNFNYACDYAEGPMKQQLKGYQEAVEKRIREAEEARQRKHGILISPGEPIRMSRGARIVCIVLFCLFAGWSLFLGIFGTVEYAEPSTDLLLTFFTLLTLCFVRFRHTGWAIASGFLNVVMSAFGIVYAATMNGGDSYYVECGWGLAYSIVMAVFAFVLLLYALNHKRHGLFAIVFFVMAAGWCWPPFIETAYVGGNMVLVQVATWLMLAAGLSALLIGSKPPKQVQSTESESGN